MRRRMAQGLWMSMKSGYVDRSGCTQIGCKYTMNEDQKNRTSELLRKLDPAALKKLLWVLNPPVAPLDLTPCLAESDGRRMVAEAKLQARFLAQEIVRLRPQEEAGPSHLSYSREPPNAQICLALDDRNREILVTGARSPLGSSRDYEMLAKLVAQSRRDRGAWLKPENHKWVALRTLAGKYSEQTTRQRIFRLRTLLKKACPRANLGTHSIIQSHRGYRINPEVYLVTPDELLGSTERSP